MTDLDPRMEVPGDDEYSRQYSEDGFREKLRTFGRAAGREVVEKALILYYTARSPNVPRWAKATIYGALGYFVTPIDAIPDLTPLVGYTDDLGVLAAALAVVLAHVTPEIRARARERAREWLGD